MPPSWPTAPRSSAGSGFPKRRRLHPSYPPSVLPTRKTRFAPHAREGSNGIRPVGACADSSPDGAARALVGPGHHARSLGPGGAFPSRDVDPRRRESRSPPGGLSSSDPCTAPVEAQVRGLSLPRGAHAPPAASMGLGAGGLSRRCAGERERIGSQRRLPHRASGSPVALSEPPYGGSRRPGPTRRREPEIRCRRS